MIEEWLSRRHILCFSPEVADAMGQGYQKVLELYCLQILPKLEQWDYAREFLEYEGELLSNAREVCFQNLGFDAIAPN